MTINKKERADYLSGAVSKAIYDAEVSDKQSIAAWELVKQLERELTFTLDKDDPERDIAVRGVAYANAKIAIREIKL